MMEPDYFIVVCWTSAVRQNFRSPEWNQAHGVDETKNLGSAAWLFIQSPKFTWLFSL